MLVLSDQGVHLPSRSMSNLKPNFTFRNQWFNQKLQKKKDNQENNIREAIRDEVSQRKFNVNPVISNSF